MVASLKGDTRAAAGKPSRCSAQYIHHRGRSGQAPENATPASFVTRAAEAVTAADRALIVCHAADPRYSIWRGAGEATVLSRRDGLRLTPEGVVPMRHWKLIVFVVAAVLTIVVVVQNTQTVETKLLFITLTMPRAVLLFVTLLIGFVLGVVSAGKITGKWLSREAQAGR
jgi:putative membrane protein